MFSSRLKDYATFFSSGLSGAKQALEDVVASPTVQTWSTTLQDKLQQTKEAVIQGSEIAMDKTIAYIGQENTQLAFEKCQQIKNSIFKQSHVVKEKCYEVLESKDAQRVALYFTKSSSSIYASKYFIELSLLAVPISSGAYFALSTCRISLIFSMLLFSIYEQYQNKKCDDEIQRTLRFDQEKLRETKKVMKKLEESYLLIESIAGIHGDDTMIHAKDFKEKNINFVDRIKDDRSLDDMIELFLQATKSVTWIEMSLRYMNKHKEFSSLKYFLLLGIYLCFVSNIHQQCLEIENTEDILKLEKELLPIYESVRKIQFKLDEEQDDTLWLAHQYDKRKIGIQTFQSLVSAFYQATGKTSGIYLFSKMLMPTHEKCIKLLSVAVLLFAMIQSRYHHKQREIMIDKFQQVTSKIKVLEDTEEVLQILLSKQLDYIQFLKIDRLEEPHYIKARLSH